MVATASVSVPPRFTRQGLIGSAILAVGQAKNDGTGTISGGTVDTWALVAADATNGSGVDYVYFMPTASAASTGTAAATGRVYRSTVNTGSTSSSNTYLLGEVNLPAVTAAAPTSAQYPIIWTPPHSGLIQLAPGDYLLVQTSINPNAGTAWVAHALYGHF
jgi:hypothetical protein